MDLNLDTFTASQLTTVRANDFVRVIALAVKHANDPDPVYTAVRTFTDHYPRSLSRDIFTKGAVAAGTTIDSTWAGPLATVQPLTDSFLQLLRPRTLIGRIPGIRHVPLNTSVASQTTGGVYGWIGQAGATPATKSDFATISVPPAKAGGIITVTKELAALGTPSAINELREEMIAGLAQFLDSQFLDPTVAVSANVSPASVTNGAGTAASVGTSQANAATDIEALITAFAAGNPNLENLVLIMRPSNALALARATGSQTLGLLGGSYFGIPVIVSQSAAAVIVALDASQILVGEAEPGLDIDISTQAAYQADSAPDATTTASTVLISLFGTNLIGLRCTRYISWKRVAATAVRTVTAANYV